jgi:hypothetical protein
MRILDICVQSLLIGLAAVSLLSVDGGFILVAFVQFFIGVWQLLSAIISTSKMKQYPELIRKRLKIYWLLVAVYFLVALVLYVLAPMDKSLGFFAWFFSAWGIAIYYFILTIAMLRKKGEKNSYLDVMN